MRSKLDIVYKRLSVKWSLFQNEKDSFRVFWLLHRLCKNLEAIHTNNNCPAQILILRLSQTQEMFEL